MQEETFQLQSQSGEDLYLRVWKPTGIAELTGAVIISHGLGEHCGRYTHVARHFTRQGFSVYGADHVGFGRSGGRRGHVPGGIETCVADLRQVQHLAAAEAGERGRQVFLGHSMGGLFVLSHLLDHPHLVSTAILSGPALNAGHSTGSFQRAMVHILGGIFPFLTRDHGIPSQAICSVEEVVARYVADPLVHRRLSFGLIKAILEEGHRVRSSVGSFHPQLALLLLHGAEDRIALSEDTQAFARQLPCEDVEIHILEGMQHEVFNETERALTFGILDRFLGLKDAV